MKTSAVALALILSTVAHADSSNGDMSDRGGSGDLFTDPTSSCIEQSTFAVLQHFYPEHSFGVPCGFTPDPLPPLSPTDPPAPPIDPPPVVGTVPEPGSAWMLALGLGIMGLFVRHRGAHIEVRQSPQIK